MKPAAAEDPLAFGIALCLKDHPDRQFRAISGHLGATHLRRLATALPLARAFTFLRDPVARLLSECRSMRTPKHPPQLAFCARYPGFADYPDDPASGNAMWWSVSLPGERPDGTGLARVMGRHAFIPPGRGTGRFAGRRARRWSPARIARFA